MLLFAWKTEMVKLEQWKDREDIGKETNVVYWWGNDWLLRLADVCGVGREWIGQGLWLV